MEKLLATHEGRYDAQVYLAEEISAEPLGKELIALALSGYGD